jgi:hypothetical protein
MAAKPLPISGVEQFMSLPPIAMSSWKRKIAILWTEPMNGISMTK